MASPVHCGVTKRVSCLVWTLRHGDLMTCSVIVVQFAGWTVISRKSTLSVFVIAKCCMYPRYLKLVAHDDCCESVRKSHYMAAHAAFFDYQIQCHMKSRVNVNKWKGAWQKGLPDIESLQCFRLINITSYDKNCVNVLNKGVWQKYLLH